MIVYFVYEICVRFSRNMYFVDFLMMSNFLYLDKCNLFVIVIIINRIKYFKYLINYDIVEGLVYLYVGFNN